MSFINWIMLGGVAALSVPLIIHLFNRSRFRVIEWGAMHLLANVVRINRKRIRLEQLLLLIIRCAIPAVLALLMARPVLTGWRALTGDAPASTVVLLDNSYSMDAAAGSRTNFQIAVDEASSVISRLKRGSDVSVMLMGGGAEPIFDKPVFDTRSIVDQLQMLKPRYGAADTVGAFTAGSAALSKMSHAKRDLILVSDFQKANWADVDAPARQRLTELVTGMNVPASLTFMRVGDEVKENLAVESLDFSRQILGVGQTLTVRGNLRNHGARAYQNVRVYFRVDGKEHSASQVSLAGRETAQVLFTVTFEEAGSHVVQVELDGVDLRADNSYVAAVPVLGQIPVLLVNGDPSRQPLGGETDFLEIALQPYTAARDTGKLADLVKTQTIELDKLKPEALADVRAVVLANVPSLSDEQLQALRQFVTNGGGLLVLPGNKVQLAWYNTKFADPNSGLLPMKLDEIAGSTDDAAQHTAIVAQHYEHPALSMFNNRASGDLSDAVVRTWYRLSSATGGALGAPGQPSVLARLETGDPLLVEKKLGDGTVIQAATAADADWSNLPMRPFYLPLMQQLVVYLATNIEPPRNVEAGQPLVAFVPEHLVDQPLTLIDPDGGKVNVKPVSRSGRGVVEHANTRRPGLYLLNMPEAPPVHFVVNTPRTESDLAQVNDEELAKIAESMNASVVRSADEYAVIDAERRHGREIWKALLLALLALVFAELYLQQRFAKGAQA